MDCIRFWTVIFACGFIFFMSLFLIIKYQVEFYRYPIKDQSSSETTVLVASIFYLLATIVFIIWGKRRDQRKQQELQNHYNNLPANQFDAPIEREEKQVSEKEFQ